MKDLNSQNASNFSINTFPKRVINMILQYESYYRDLNSVDDRRLSSSTLSLSISLDQIDDELRRFKDFCGINKNIVEYVTYRHV